MDYLVVGILFISIVFSSLWKSLCNYHHCDDADKNPHTENYVLVNNTSDTD